MDEKKKQPAGGQAASNLDYYDCPETPPTQSDAYMDAVLPDHVKKALEERSNAAAKKLAAE